MAKKRKFKIPNRSDNREARLENRYKKALIKMLQHLYPEENYKDNDRFSRVAVNDIINPVTHKKEYGVVFFCRDTVFSVVEAFEGIDDLVLAFCIEGLTVGRDLCSYLPYFNPHKLKAIVFEKDIDPDQPFEIIVDRGIVKNFPIVFSVDEMINFNELFETYRDGLPIRIFNPATDPKASLCFEEAKQILTKIPNRRVPRDLY